MTRLNGKGSGGGATILIIIVVLIVLFLLAYFLYLKPNGMLNLGF
jgi:flagellar basal body-associated protein FliL